VTGDGPLDLLIVPGFISHLEQAWEDASYARFLQRLASFSRLIRFDKRGTGLSDRIAEIPTLEQRMDDVPVPHQRIARRVVHGEQLLCVIQAVLRIPCLRGIIRPERREGSPSDEARAAPSSRARDLLDGAALRTAPALRIRPEHLGYRH
jgi:hypothetical protein